MEGQQNPHRLSHGAGQVRDRSVYGYDQIELFYKRCRIVGAPLKRSKLEIFPRYRFNVCFENAMFPGYYTEKILHAWAGGCVPLYFADRFACRDFNPAAMVNRADFAT